MMKKKQHLTKEGLEQVKRIKADMNRGRINLTDCTAHREVQSPGGDLPKGKRFISTACNVDREQEKIKIDLPGVVVIKPYLYKTNTVWRVAGSAPTVLLPGYGYQGKEVALKNNGVWSKVNLILDISGSVGRWPAHSSTPTQTSGRLRLEFLIYKPDMVFMLKTGGAELRTKNIFLFGRPQGASVKVITLNVINYLRVACVISATKLRNTERYIPNTASSQREFIVNLDTKENFRAALSKVKAKLLEIYIPGASIIGHSLARDRTIKGYLKLNLPGTKNNYNKITNHQLSLANARQAANLFTRLKTQYSNIWKQLTPIRPQSFLQPLNQNSLKLRNFSTTPRLNNHEG